MSPIFPKIVEDAKRLSLFERQLDFSGEIEGLTEQLFQD